MEKAELYADGITPKRMGADETLRLKNGIKEIMVEAEQAAVYEGLTGASPREMRTLLLDAAQHPEYACLSPLAVLACIRALCRGGDYGFLRETPSAGYHDHPGFIEQVRERWLDRVDREFRDSTGLVEEARYGELFDRYITHVSHWIKGERVFNRVTGVNEEPDREMMASVEKTLGAGSNAETLPARPDQRHRRLRHRSSRATRSQYGKVFPRHLERLKEAYFADRRKQLQEIGQDILRLLANEEQKTTSATNARSWPRPPASVSTRATATTNAACAMRWVSCWRVATSPEVP